MSRPVVKCAIELMTSVWEFQRINCADYAHFQKKVLYKKQILQRLVIWFLVFVNISQKRQYTKCCRLFKHMICSDSIPSGEGKSHTSTGISYCWSNAYEEHHDKVSSLSTFWVIDSRRLSWSLQELESGCTVLLAQLRYKNLIELNSYNAWKYSFMN
jgi:hypothetical protein